MLKAKIVSLCIKFGINLILIGLGIWYVSVAIGGSSISFSSIDNFLSAIGVKDGDIASSNSCFLCSYIERLFAMIGNVAENFWIKIVGTLSLLVFLGFGIFLIVSIAEHLYEASKKNAVLDAGDKKLEFKPLFDKILNQGIRVIIVGSFLVFANTNNSNISFLKSLSSIVISPVMLIGSEISMIATKTAYSSSCNMETKESNDLLNPIMRPFMCTISNINFISLAGVSGGFALMNYSWLGLGGGTLTWLAGFGLIIMFMLIGFNLFFQILSVLFKLIFIIIFFPIIIFFYTFEKTWTIAKNVVPNAFNMIIDSSVKIVSVTLKTLVLYSIISFCADEYFPAPQDGYNAILPPILENKQNIDAKTDSIISVFSNCEKISIEDGKLDKDKFKNCFTAKKAEVERKYPGAFDFMDNGFEFIILMIGIFFIYFYLVSPKIDEILGSIGKEEFDYGGYLKTLGKTVKSIPERILKMVNKSK